MAREHRKRWRDASSPQQAARTASVRGCVRAAARRSAAEWSEAPKYPSARHVCAPELFFVFPGPFSSIIADAP
eukprot:6173488-Pleurochrysis_carterae.AAC.2